MHVRYNTTTKVWESSTDMVAFTPLVEHFMGGAVGIGNTAPDSLTKLDVTGGIHAIPVCALFIHTGLGVGFGSFIWDTAAFTNTSYFTRQNSNTEIKFLRAGKYLIIAYVAVSNIAASVESPAYIKGSGGASLIKSMASAATSGKVQHSMSVIIDMGLNGIIYVENSNDGGNRYGEAGPFVSTLSIYKLN